MKVYNTLTPEQDAAWWEAARKGRLQEFLARRGNLDTMAYIREQIASDGGVEMSQLRRHRYERPSDHAPAPGGYEGREDYLKYLEQRYS